MSISKCVTASLLTLVGAATAVSCARRTGEEPMIPAAATAPRVTAREAADTITAERCAAAERCGGGEGSKYTSVEQCRNAIGSNVNRSFASNDDCNNGVPDARLRSCRAEIANEDCSGLSALFDRIDRTMTCRSGHLCMD